MEQVRLGDLSVQPGMERPKVWPVGLESIQEDCLTMDTSSSSSSDISDDEAKAEMIDQAEFEHLELSLENSFGQSSPNHIEETKTHTTEQLEFERLEYTLDRTFGRPCPREEDESAFFDDPLEDAFRLYANEPLEIDTTLTTELTLDEHKHTTNLPPESPTKSVGAKRSKLKRNFSIEEGRREIEKRLKEMRRTEIDQISFMLRSLSSESLKEVVSKYLMSQPPQQVRVRCSIQLARPSSWWRTGTSPGRPCCARRFP